MPADQDLEEIDSDTSRLPKLRNGRPLYALVFPAFLIGVIGVIAFAGEWRASPEAQAAGSNARSGETNSERLAASLDDGSAVLPASEWAINEVALLPSRPFKYSGSTGDRNKAIDCLAFASWYEAGDRPSDQRAVMQTILNRVSHAAFPNSVCGVVFEGSHLQTGCQFTFTCDGSIQARTPSDRAMDRARKLAEEALNGRVDQSIGTATHYHANYVDPWWAGRLDRVAIVGPHIFYKWRGSAGVIGKQRRLETEVEFREMVAKRREQDLAGIDANVGGEQAAQLALAPYNAPSPATAVRPISSNTHYTTVENIEANGRWALSALKTCRGRKSCQILGYGTGAEAARNRDAPLSARHRPLFLFVRDAASGMEIALWDCERVTRKNSAQCLPGDEAALLKLMKERS
ncbi:cell wall hydrolase [Erythrobacter ani]|uniref:Cell wall hydrolase n=1 Tax=Erythrobacter ani TaxID=2827235 RepID=A0ABS6SN98_9SPHN|nr:cell wall hydrolase [Erythrobacter ani]MBV7266316.1 cell wall hydrolase [Erythrobacter ani]